MIFSIEYIEDANNKSLDLKLLKDWTNNGAKVKSIEGVIGDYNEDLIIKLTNDITIEFEANLEPGPSDSYYKDSGKRNPNFAHLKVKNKDGNILHNFEDVKGIFIESLADYGSIPLTVLQTYIKIITFKIDRSRAIEFRGASIILTSLIEDYQFNPLHYDYHGFINTSIKDHHNQKAFIFLVNNYELFKPFLDTSGFYIGENPSYDEFILYKKK